MTVEIDDAAAKKAAAETDEVSAGEGSAEEIEGVEGLGDDPRSGSHWPEYP